VALVLMRLIDALSLILTPWPVGVLAAEQDLGSLRFN